MKRRSILLVFFLLFFVLLTQIGWLSNGFYGFQMGFLPAGSGWAVFWGVVVILGALLILKIIRWWRK